LTAGGVDVFSTAAAEAGVDAVFFEVLHEFLDGVVIGFGEEGLVDGVVLDDIDEIGGHAAVELDEFVGVLRLSLKSLNRIYSKVISLPVC
jgi:hypothetical protein